VSTRPPPRAPASRPAVGRAGRHPTRGALAVATLAVAAAVAGGCGSPTPSQPVLTPSPTPSPTASPGGPAGSALLLLAVADNARVLSLLQPSTEIVALPLPDPTTMAVTPMHNGTLVALLADGRAFVAPGGAAGLLAGTAWQPLDLRWDGALPGTSIVFGATASPDGTRLAAIARPPDAEGPSALLVIDPAEGRGVIRPLAAESLGAPPAWLDDSRVALVQRDRVDRTLLSIITVATGRVVDQIEFRALDFGTSGDAGTAVVHGDESRLLVGPIEEVLERRRAPDEGPITSAGDAIGGGIALDREGRHLAAVVDDEVAGVSRIAIFERVGGAWRTAARLPAPRGSRGGTIAWLP